MGNLAKNNTNFRSIIRIKLIVTLSVHFLPFWPPSFVEVSIVIETPKDSFFFPNFLPSAATTSWNVL